MNQATLEDAHKHLLKADPVLARVVREIGAPQLHFESDAWRALTGSIIGQQVSVHAARAIRNRFAALDGESDYPAPARVLAMSEETLRGCGLSRNKVLAVRDLARHFEEDLIDTEKFAAMSDEEIIQTLMPVRGIGRWTAEMFLIFSLGRNDVFAVDDLGLRNAMKKLYALEEIPKPAQMREIAEVWKPYRSVASWYLWRSLDNVPKLEK